MGGSMRIQGCLLPKFAAVLLLGILLLVIPGTTAGIAQQPQPAAAQPVQKPQQHAANLDVGNAPTPTDMYCSGFITNEHVPDKIFVAAGSNSPDESRYAGVSDVVFLHGRDIQEGGRYQIVRHVRDTNHYESYNGQRSAVHNAGDPYFELAIVRVHDVQKETGIAAFELSCADVMPGDIAIPL